MMMPIMEAVLIELEGATSTEVEDKSRTNIRKLLALSVHSVENIVAEVTFHNNIEMSKNCQNCPKMPKIVQN